METIAIDFDGTIVEDTTFPNIGKELEWNFFGRKIPATQAIKELKNAGYGIVIHTCRTHVNQQMVIKWMEFDAKVPLRCGFDYQMNYNIRCPEAFQKPMAEVYLDNRGLRFVEEMDVGMAIKQALQDSIDHVYVPSQSQI